MANFYGQNFPKLSQISNIFPVTIGCDFMVMRVSSQRSTEPLSHRLQCGAKDFGYVMLEVGLDSQVSSGKCINT